MKDSTDNLIVSSEQTPDAAAPVLSAGERHKLLIEWNQTQRDYPRDKCIHQLFEEQGERAPDAVAVVFEGSSLTYRELNARANQVAQHLGLLGVKPRELIGLRMDRCLEMVVALLGILKAGGTYWALEENLPEERIQTLLVAARPGLLLVQRKSCKQYSDLVDKLPAHSPAGGVIVAAVEDLLASAPEENLFRAPASQASDAAYVSFTSGSTGQPKGVVVPHRGVVRLVQNTNYVSLNAGETLLHLSPLSFDASTFEIWGTLLNGGRVVLMPPGRPTVAEIGEVIRRQGVTTLWLTAGLFHLMVDERLADLLPLRQLLAGGDVLSPEQVIKARRALPGCRIINGYGPTENTTFTCCYAVAEERDLTPSVPIGVPISNTQVYVLDPLLQPVPVGVAGELYAGGDGVACGYLNQPELTAERFIPDSFAAVPGARLYRTGDRVRWRPDGNLEFLGRLDSQIKIRGFRVELGEIEVALGMHPNVSACAVVASKDGSGDLYLSAFFVVRDTSGFSVGALRSWLKEKLPDYMIPSRFLAVPALPLNSNGKVDRKALRSLDGAELASGIDYVAPRNAREAELADIWQVVLRRERVGIHDDFFALGGHSLLAVRMLSRVHDATGVMPTLGRFFAHPRIQNLSTFIEEEKVRLSIEGGGSPRIGDEQTPLFLLKNALNLKSAGLGDRRYYVIPFPDCTSSMAQCRVEFLAEQCLEKLRTIQPHGPYILVGHSLPGLVAYEMACRLCAEGEEVPLVVIIDTTPATFLERMAPALIGSVGARLRLPFQLQLFLAGVWFYANNRLRRFRHVPGPQWRRGWRELRNDLARIKAIWRSKRNRPAPMLGGHVLQTKSAPARSFLGLGGFTSQSPLLWTRNAFKPKPYAGCVALFLAEERAFESSTPGCGWKQWTSRLQEYSLPGDHVSCVTQHKDVLVEKLLRCLATVENKIPK